MQTFLPYPSFFQSLNCVDYKRLGKQRVEARQILKALESPNSWSRHPAVRMWQGYKLALIEYGNIAIRVWVNRGYKNTMPLMPISRNIEYPWWLGSKAFHDSHKSNLLRKDRGFYSQYGWNVPDNLPYVWPCS